MLYCAPCMMLSDDESKCHNCGKSKLRAPKESDPVFLLELQSLWSGGIEDVLSENGIPCLKRGVKGPGLSFILGEGFETYQFFVPYSAYEKARELTAAFLPEDAEPEDLPEVDECQSE